MDNLTHSLVGVLLSRAGFNRSVPHATALLVFAANAPDIDVFTYLGGGAESYFEYHRGITHAIVATPLMAIVPVLLVRLLFRKDPVPWLKAWLISIAGVASHWLLDYTNAYGIRLLEPFSDAWPALDITSVVDIWIWLVLLFAALWPMLARMVTSEIGGRRNGRIGRGWAITALLFLLFYNSARVFLRDRVIAVQEARMYNGQTPRRALAFPTPFNPLRWKGVVETSTFWVVQDVLLTEELDPTAGVVHYKPAASPAIEAARKTRAIRLMEWWSKSLLWRTTPAASLEGGTLVEALDLRLGFAATALVDAQGQVRESSLAFRPR